MKTSVVTVSLVWAAVVMVGCFTATASQTAESGVCCALCGQPIHGQFWRVPNSTETYCADCYNNNPHCDFCGRPFVPDTPLEPGERKICSVCQAGRISDMALVRRALNQIQTWITANLKLRLPANIKVETTRDLGPRPAPRHALATVVTTPDAAGYTIRVLDGLPEPMLLEALAHELGHIWLQEYCPNDPGVVLREGFAQWMAAQVLKGFQQHKALATLEQRPDVYGESYRHVQQLERELGLPKMLERLCGATF